MKAEERKELKQNSLVATIGKVGHGLKEGPSRLTVIIVGIAVLVGLLVAVWMIVGNVSTSRNSSRWLELQKAASPEDLTTLIEKNRDTVQGRSAALQVARDNLREGLVEVYVNRGEAEKKLTQAADSFEKLARDFKGTPILVQECLFGAGQAREALGKFDEAIALYEKVASDFKDSLLAKQAGQLAEKVKEKKAQVAQVISKESK